ncbi:MULTISPECIES: nuclear transport factor 2-like protein [Flavobacterium]|uniref:Uncharacterized protein n=1 Tax=Flavobacterium chungangense TaxID=554283 RepID=A0A6V6Z032_9FLAO|nr:MULTISPECIES: nuclear transport factor 2 family protein [Flavobacterium]CAD0004834.1 hypothetical protein FLACHUCJ7_02052 [Flavobacterium chungangense]
MDTNQTSLSIALKYFNAWCQNDFEKTSSFLSDKIAFEMLINSYVSKAEFLQAVQFTASTLQEVILLTHLGNKEEAVLIYTLKLTGLAPLQICEHFKVRESKITFISHVHDTHELRNAGFDKNKT